MKPNIISLLLIVLVLSLISCNKNEGKLALQKDVMAIAEISSDKKIDLNISKILNIGMLKFMDESVIVTPKKNVITSIKTNKPVMCFILADKTPVIFYLQPGKKITVKLTEQNGKVFTDFSKDDYINKFTKEFHKAIIPLMTDALDQNEILKKINTSKSDLLTKLNSLKSKIDPVAYDVLNAMVIGKMDHIKFMQSERFKDLTPKSTYFDFTDHYIFDNDYYLTYSDNLNTIISVLRTQYERSNPNSFDTAPDMLDFVSKSVKSEELKSEVLSFLLSRRIPQMTNNEKKKLIGTLKEMKIGEKYVHFLSSLEAGTALGRKIGNPAKYIGSLKSYDKNFNTDQLKGKIVYMDNWATWCGPCMKSIKKFNNKQKDLKQSDDIVYVFVSFDRKESIWKNFLEKNSFTAKNVVHLFNGSDMNSDYGKYYNISELPFYMVVGKDGKVKDIDPKEPMDDEYELYIQQLIK
jgi:thiol-disulfide isomerase/thioredoxin